MKRLLLLILISCVIFIIRSKKKQQEFEIKEKVKKQITLKKIKSVKTNKTDIVNYIFENKENFLDTINVFEMPLKEEVILNNIHSNSMAPKILRRIN